MSKTFATMKPTDSYAEPGDVTPISGRVNSLESRTAAVENRETAVENRTTNVESRTTSLESGKVDKVEGKGLSSNDYTDSEKQRLNNAVSSLQNKLNKNQDDETSGLLTFTGAAPKVNVLGEMSGPVYDYNYYEQVGYVSADGTGIIIPGWVLPGGEDVIYKELLSPFAISAFQRYRYDGAYATLVFEWTSGGVIYCYGDNAVKLVYLDPYIWLNDVSVSGNEGTWSGEFYYHDEDGNQYTGWTEICFYNYDGYTYVCINYYVELFDEATGTYYTGWASYTFYPTEPGFTWIPACTGTLTTEDVLNSKISSHENSSSAHYSLFSGKLGSGHASDSNAHSSLFTAKIEAHNSNATAHDAIRASVNIARNGFYWLSNRFPNKATNNELVASVLPLDLVLHDKIGFSSTGLGALCRYLTLPNDNAEYSHVVKFLVPTRSDADKRPDGEMDSNFRSDAGIPCFHEIELYFPFYQTGLLTDYNHGFNLYFDIAADSTASTFTRKKIVTIPRGVVPPMTVNRSLFVVKLKATLLYRTSSTSASTGIWELLNCCLLIDEVLYRQIDAMPPDGPASPSWQYTGYSYPNVRLGGTTWQPLPTEYLGDFFTGE